MLSVHKRRESSNNHQYYRILEVRGSEVTAGFSHILGGTVDIFNVCFYLFHLF